MHKGIISDPAILNGKPIIKGTRIAVSIILDLIADGYSNKEITELYPHISEKDVINCIRFASKLCNIGEISVPYEDTANGQVSL